jgi:ABC-type sugar transport system permease subunit
VKSPGLASAASLTAGSRPPGQARAGLTLITYLNDVAYRSGDLGLGSAVGWVVALMIMTFSFVQFRVSSVSEHE